MIIASTEILKLIEKNYPLDPGKMDILDFRVEICTIKNEKKSIHFDLDSKWRIHFLSNIISAIFGRNSGSTVFDLPLIFAG